MATKRVRAGKWHYTIRRAGLLPRPVYLTFADEAEGDEYVRRLEALLDRGVVPDEFAARAEVPKSLRDSVRRYLGATHVAYQDKRILMVVLQRLPIELPLSALSFAWASSWVRALKREQNLAPSTIRHHVGALARALDWVAAHGELVFNPLRLLPTGYATYTPDDVAAVVRIDGRTKVDSERDRRLEVGEEDAIRSILAGTKPDGRQRPLELRHAEHLQLLFEMALESAMRMREMFTLVASQVDLAKRTVFLDKTKNGSRRQVPLTSVLVRQLTPVVNTLDPAEQVFPWWDGDAERRSLERTTALLSRQFARVFSAAGCADLHFHDLRHEATSRLFERTALSDLEIAKITGHKSPTMLARYANLRGSSLAARLW